MVKRFKKFDPQLVFAEQTAGSAVVLTNEQKLSLYKKSQKSGISTDILEEVYRRGYIIWNESFGQTAEQFAFDRVNSFIAGGFAINLDEDLMIDEGKKRGLWDNIHAKRERIKHGSGEHMRKPGSKGAPTAADFKNSQNEETVEEDWSDSKYKNPSGGLTKAGVMAYRRENPGSKLKTAVTTKPSKLKPGSKAANRRKSFCARMGGMKKRLTSAKTAHDPDSRINKALRKWHCEEYTGSDPKSNDPNNPLARMDGTYSGASVYAKATPGQKLAHTPKSTLKVIKKVVKEELDEKDTDRLKKFAKELRDQDIERERPKVSVGKAEERVKPDPVTQIPAKFADRKSAAERETPTGVKKPNINTDIQRNINSRLAPVLGGLKQKMDGKFRQNSISRMSEESINEISTPLGTTGKRSSTNMKTGPVRDMTGKIIRSTVFKSGSSRGGGGGGAGGSGGDGGEE